MPDGTGPHWQPIGNLACAEARIRMTIHRGKEAFLRFLPSRFRVQSYNFFLLAVASPFESPRTHVCEPDDSSCTLNTLS